MKKFKTTIMIGILINFFAWLFFSYNYFNRITHMSGEINHYNGWQSYSTLKISRIGTFDLNSNIIDNNEHETEKVCSGKTKIGRNSLILIPYEKQKGCLGEYSMYKASDQCYIIRSTRLKTLNHTFFICKKTS